MAALDEDLREVCEDAQRSPHWLAYALAWPLSWPVADTSGRVVVILPRRAWRLCRAAAVHSLMHATAAAPTT